ELQLRWFLTGGITKHFHRAGPLELVPIELRGTFTHGRAVVAADFDIVVTSLSMVVHPIDGRRDTNGTVFFIIKVEQNVIPDDIAIVIYSNELLGLINREVFHRVDGQILDQTQGIRVFEIEIDHVMRLIVDDRGTAPGQLFIAPIRRLRSKPRYHRWWRLGFPEQ